MKTLREAKIGDTVKVVADSLPVEGPFVDPYKIRPMIVRFNPRLARPEILSRKFISRIVLHCGGLVACRRPYDLM